MADQQPGSGVDSPQTAIDAVGQTRDALHNSSDPTLQDWSQRLDEALSIIEDVSSDLHTYLEELNVDPAVLEEKLARQALVKAIVRKYGVDVDAVLRWKNEAEARIAELDSSETTLDELRDDVTRLHDEMRDASRALTTARKKRHDVCSIRLPRYSTLWPWRKRTSALVLHPLPVVTHMLIVPVVFRNPVLMR
ncbi:MAG: hypothetical protein U1U88_002487 [Lawsonella clevelandensis]